LFEQALAISIKHFAPRHHQTLKARVGLAESMLASGEPDAAREVLSPIGEFPPQELAATDPVRQRLIAVAEQLDIN